jgi:hypothetical protein
METPLLVLLLVQGVLGGIDTLLNHELIARLPQRPGARTEIGLHVIREAIWASLFLGLGWLAWQGAAAGAIALLVAAEVLVTALDEYVENRSRVLPQNERVLHVFLTLNLGLIIALLVPILLAWGSRPTALVPQSYGVASWILSALAFAAGTWSFRDLLAWRRLA